MNTFKRLGVSVIILLIFVVNLSGCVAYPTYNGNGNYSSYRVGVNVPQVANTVTGAAIGAAVGAPFGLWKEGAAVGGFMGAMEPTFPEVGYASPMSPQSEYHHGRQIPDYLYGENYYQPRYQNQGQYYGSSCREQYEMCIQSVNVSFQNKSLATSQFLQDTGNRAEYDRIMQEIQIWYNQSLKNAELQYARCVRYMR